MEFGPLVTPAITNHVVTVEAKLRELISDINSKLIKVRLYLKLKVSALSELDIGIQRTL